jgi:hypothetical protein
VHASAPSPSRSRLFDIYVMLASGIGALRPAPAQGAPDGADDPGPGAHGDTARQEPARGLVLSDGSVLPFFTPADPKGSFVWRPAGSRHVASAPDGALLLGIFQKPNQFY